MPSFDQILKSRDWEMKRGLADNQQNGLAGKTTACGKSIAKNLSLPEGTGERKHRISFDEDTMEIRKK